MSAPDSTFYVTGGTLRQDAACYVERQADKDLLEGLVKGEFCYVLTSRQMGKSSLMVRTAGKLRDQGVRVVVLDLTAIGQNITPEQWYDGLMLRLGQQLRLEDQLEDFWKSHANLGPCQRFFAAIRTVALPTPQKTQMENPKFEIQKPKSAPLVLFVDELDVVRSLSFSTDEFFAAIRECNNRRAEDPEINRLTFCLLGVATPSELTRDTRITPFNIGRRIELNDFSPEEAAPLAKGLVSPKSEVQGPKSSEQAGANSELSTLNSQLLLDRILYWTNGHPYLTQRLCRALADGSSRPEEVPSDKSAIRNPPILRSGPAEGGQSAIDQSLLTSAATSLIDAVCTELFFSSRAREQDDNLLFVRERLLRAEVDQAGLLILYEQVARHRRVTDDETNSLVSVLRLSGLARARAGCLEPRNRIYERVFDRAWIQANMPDAELRRQRAAYRRGAIRVAAVALLIVAAFGLLTAYSFKVARRAAILGDLAIRGRARAEAEELTARRNLYAADMNLAQQAVEAGDLGRARALLDGHRPPTGQEDLRGFEWRHLWGVSRGDNYATLRGHSNVVSCVAVSPDGRTVLSGSQDRTVRLWDFASQRQVALLPSAFNLPNSAGFSSDGKVFAIGSRIGTTIWSTEGLRLLTNVAGAWTDVAFAPAGTLLAIGSGRGYWPPIGDSMTIWDYRTLQQVASFPQGGGRAAFSRDGTLVALSGRGEGVTVWHLARKERVASLPGSGHVQAMAFAPDGRSLVVSDNEGRSVVWDWERRQIRASLSGHTLHVWQLAFSPDGNTLATASGDQTVRLWDTSTWQTRTVLTGHGNEIWNVAFTPDGHNLVTSSKDETIMFWPVEPERLPEAIQGLASEPVISPDSSLVAAQTADGRTTLWQASYGQPTTVLEGERQPVAFARDGKSLVTLQRPATFTFWNTASHAIESETRLQYDRGIQEAKLAPDGQTVATTGTNQEILFWNVLTGEARGRIERHTDGLPSLAFSPDSRLVATVVNAKVSVLEVSTLLEVATISRHKMLIKTCAFSPDGALVATGSADGTINLWRFRDGPEVVTLTGHKESAFRLTFSADGKTLASVSHHTVKLWNLATHREVATITVAESEPGLAFSADGRLFAIGGAGQTLHLLRAPSFQEIEVAEKSERGR